MPHFSNAAAGLFSVAAAGVLAIACTTIAPAGTVAPATVAPASVASTASVAPTDSQSESLQPSPEVTSAPPTATAAASPSAAVTNEPPPPPPTKTPKPTKAPTPTPSPTPAPAKVKSFTAPNTIDCNVDPEPTQIHLEWSVARATGVTISIDGPGIYDSYDGATGAADVPFACGSDSHTYLITTTGSDGAQATEKRVVKRAEPKIVNVYADNLSVQGACTQVYQRRVYWVVENAKGVTITVNGQQYGPYTGHEGNDLLPYDCRNGAQPTYHFETTGYGPAATQDYSPPYSTYST